MFNIKKQFLQLPVLLLLLHDSTPGSNKDRGPDQGLAKSGAMNKYQNHKESTARLNIQNLLTAAILLKALPPPNNMVKDILIFQRVLTKVKAMSLLKNLLQILKKFLTTFS